MINFQTEMFISKYASLYNRITLTEKAGIKVEAVVGDATYSEKTILR